MKKSFLWTSALNVIFILMQHIDETFSSHYFHQYPHGLHIKNVETKLIEIQTNNNTVLPTTLPETTRYLNSTSSTISGNTLV